MLDIKLSDPQIAGLLDQAQHDVSGMSAAYRRVFTSLPFQPLELGVFAFRRFVGKLPTIPIVA